jgi:hypothetical protein
MFVELKAEILLSWGPTLKLHKTNEFSVSLNKSVVQVIQCVRKGAVHL